MSKPHNYAKPDLSRLSTRRMSVSMNRQTLEMDLLGWVSDIVRATHQPRQGALRPETYLMASAQDSIDVLQHAASISMATGRANGKVNVHADFHWRRNPDGHWIVDAVAFSLNGQQAAMQIGRQLAYRQRLIDKAEERSAAYIDVRKIAFPIDKLPLERFPDELHFGDQLIHNAIQVAYRKAKEEVKALENPVEPVDMALDLATMGVGHLPKTTELAEQLEKVHGIADRGKTALDASKAYLDKEKSAGDRALGVGVNVAGVLPGGGYIKMFAGMFFEIAIASDAARVAKLRSRCYVHFVAGYAGRITMTDMDQPTEKEDRTFFDLGVSMAPPVGSPGGVRAQMSLLHYASEHYTSGGWHGLGFRPEHWDFPDRYIQKWSPGLVGQALATQLHTKEFLTE
jgi:hypothetical protein